MAVHAGAFWASPPGDWQAVNAHSAAMLDTILHFMVEPCAGRRRFSTSPCPTVRLRKVVYEPHGAGRRPLRWDVNPALIGIALAEIAEIPSG
jgi:hypothetical protein